MLVTAFAVKYGQPFADKISKAWAEKQHQDDPRKSTYLLVQKPSIESALPKTFAKCGKEVHPSKEAPESII